jgi:hypothetical protein
MAAAIRFDYLAASDYDLSMHETYNPTGIAMKLRPILLFGLILVTGACGGLGVGEPRAFGWLRKNCKCRAAACRGRSRRVSQCSATKKPDRDNRSQTLFDGKSLAGWRVADKFDFSGHGEVKVRGGQIEMGVGRPQTGISRDDDPPRVNYEITLEAMRTAGFDFFCGLTFPVKDDYCTLICGGWSGSTVGLSNVDGSAANENDTTTFVQFENDKWYRIRLRVTDDRIDVWIDDEHMIELKTEGRKFNIWWEQEPMRPLGIANWYSGTALRNIKLRRLEPGVAKP